MYPNNNFFLKYIYFYSQIDNEDTEANNSDAATQPNSRVPKSKNVENKITNNTTHSQRQISKEEQEKATLDISINQRRSNSHTDREESGDNYNNHSSSRRHANNRDDKHSESSAKRSDSRNSRLQKAQNDDVKKYSPKLSQQFMLNSDAFSYRPPATPTTNRDG